MSYQVSQKGSDFLDDTARHWRNPGVSKDDVWSWLWEIRETGDFQGSNLRLIKKVGKEAAERVLNWAYSHDYFVEVEDTGTLEDYQAQGQEWCEECQAWVSPDHTHQLKFPKTLDIQRRRDTHN